MTSPSGIIPLLDSSSGISAIKDGLTYALPNLHFRPPSVFSSLAFTESLIIKMPVDAWLEDFRRHVARRQDAPSGGLPLVRPADAEEKNVEALLIRFPEFRSAYAQHAEYAHFLMVHRLQHERLKSSKAIRIPQSRFIFIRRTQFWFFKKLMPIIVQERITGMPLLEMVEENVDAIIPKWIQFLPKINPRLHELMSVDLKNHLNWFIKNFLYDSTRDVLWYVDAKPSCLFARKGNDENIRGLHEIFFKYE